MKRLLEQKETKEDVTKVFEVAVELKDSKLGSLLKRLNMSKVSADKKKLKLQVDSVKEEMQKARK